MSESEWVRAEFVQRPLKINSEFQDKIGKGKGDRLIMV